MGRFWLESHLLEPLGRTTGSVQKDLQLLVACPGIKETVQTLVILGSWHYILSTWD